MTASPLGTASASGMSAGAGSVGNLQRQEPQHEAQLQALGEAGQPGNTGELSAPRGGGSSVRSREREPSITGSMASQVQDSDRARSYSFDGLYGAQAHGQGQNGQVPMEDGHTGTHHHSQDGRALAPQESMNLRQMSPEL